MEIFHGMLKSKDDEIDLLNAKILDIQKEFHSQVEKIKDFEALEKLAHEEAETIKKLEKENLKLHGDIDSIEKEKEKWIFTEKWMKVKQAKKQAMIELFHAQNKLGEQILITCTYQSYNIIIVFYNFTPVLVEL